MARLNVPRNDASVTIRAPSAPAVHHHKSGNALARLGKALGGAASRLQKQQEGKENFQAQNDFNAFNAQMAAAQEQMAIDFEGTDGDGMAEMFMQDTFTPAKAQFMENLPPRLQEKYGTLLSDDPEQPGEVHTKYSIGSAALQRDTRIKWYDSNIKISQEQITTAMDSMPDLTMEDFEAYREQGENLIEQAVDMPEGWRKSKRAEWQRMSEVAFLNKKMQTNPQEVLRWLNVDPRQMDPSVRATMLEQAVMGQESGGNPNAESNKGASGLMQVMPATAREIARELGDKSFPHKAPNGDEAIKAYLKEPANGLRYGKHYLRKQLRAFNGDVDAALIAYHSGPGKAREWLDNGRDDGVLGKVGKKYYKEVKARMTSLPGRGPDGKPTYRNTPNFNQMALPAANSYLRDRLSAGKGRAHVDNLQPDMQMRLAALFDAAPENIKSGLGIGSGHRTYAHQKRLFEAAVKKYGSVEAARKWVAEPGKSRHNHGKAVDLYYNGKRLDHAPPEVIKWVHANAGQFGLKFRPEMAHEPWHIELNGGATGGAPTSALAYDDRQKYVNMAQKAVVSNQSTITDVESVALRSQMDDQLNAYLSTGQGDPAFDEARIGSRLGADDYAKYLDKKQTNIDIHRATDGIKQLDSNELQQYLRDHEPSGPLNRTRQEAIHAAVEKEVKRVERQRKTAPGAAALEDPELDAMRGELVEAAQKGEPDSGSMRAFVKAMLTRQKEFGIATDSAEPIPREWALGLGRSLVDGNPAMGLPPVAALGTAKLSAIKTALGAHYRALEKVYGEYTDEVMAYAVGEYLGMDRDTAEQVADLMKIIGTGKKTVDQVLPRAEALAAAEIEEETLGGRPWGWIDIITGGMLRDDGTTPSTAEAAEQARRNAEAAGDTP